MLEFKLTKSGFAIWRNTTNRRWLVLAFHKGKFIVGYTPTAVVNHQLQTGER